MGQYNIGCDGKYPTVHFRFAWRSGNSRAPASWPIYTTTRQHAWIRYIPTRIACKPVSLVTVTPCLLFPAPWTGGWCHYHETFEGELYAPGPSRVGEPLRRSLAGKCNSLGHVVKKYPQLVGPRITYNNLSLCSSAAFHAELKS